MCWAAYRRRRRAFHRAQALRAPLRQAAKHRLSADRLAALAESLLRASEETLALLPADTSLRVAAAALHEAEALRERAAEHERADREARAKLDSPQIRRELDRLALAQAARHPKRVAQFLAERCPDALRAALRAIEPG